MELDSTDQAIVHALQVNGRMSNVELADEVKLSPSACLRRVRTLEDGGIIAGYRAEVDRTKAGLGLTVFVMLRVQQHSRETSRRIEDALTAIPAVVACHVISGEADFMIEAVVADLAAYEGMLLDEVLAVPEVVDARSIFAIRTVLHHGPVPVTHWRRTR